jgi:hypothetical protein
MKGTAMHTRTFLVAMLGSLLLAGSALGGLLANHPMAYTDPDGVTWHGSTAMANGDLSADVDWAVFAPGVYIAAFPGTGYAPAADQFVYAYQVFSTGAGPVTQMTVNMIESNEANNVGDDPVALAGVAPLIGWFGAPPPDLQTANWAFAGLVGGQNSDGLVYASVNMPLWDHAAYIVNLGTFAVGPVPTPSDVIPEPATISLLASGLVIGVVLRRRRRR